MKGFWVKIVVTILVLFFIIRTVGAQEFVVAVENLTLFVLALGIIHYVVTIIFNSFNFYLLLRAEGLKISFKSFFFYNWLTLALGQFSPARVGEVTIAKILHKKEGIDYGLTIGTYLIDKGITLSFVAVVTLLGVFFYFPLLSSWIYLIYGFFLLGVVFLILISSQNFRNFCQRILGKYQKFSKGFYKSLVRMFKNKKKFVLLNIWITTLRAFITATLFYYMFNSLGLNIPILLLVVVNAISLVAHFIPISFSGIGIKESLVVFLFAGLGYNPVIVAAMYIMMAVIYVGLNGLVAIIGVKTQLAKFL